MPLTILTSHGVISPPSPLRSKFSFLNFKFAISIYCSSSPNLSHTLHSLAIAPDKIPISLRSLCWFLSNISVSVLYSHPPLRQLAIHLEQFSSVIFHDSSFYFPLIFLSLFNYTFKEDNLRLLCSWSLYLLFLQSSSCLIPPCKKIQLPSPCWLCFSSRFDSCSDHDLSE